MSTDLEIIKAAIDDFKKIQKYMLLAKKENAVETFAELKGEYLSLKAILNTHSNADHIGGNQFLQKRFDCPIYSTPMENIVTENTILEPSFLYC